jgi:hypothetical protein
MSDICPKCGELLECLTYDSYHGEWMPTRHIIDGAECKKNVEHVKLIESLNQQSQ